MEQAIVHRKLKSKHFISWLAGSSLALAGCGIWAMHFTGMNAMTLPVQIGFNIPIVIVRFKNPLSIG
jgi:NO-binding membrane sensor protein with MHYT domain